MNTTTGAQQAVRPAVTTLCAKVNDDRRAGSCAPVVV